MEKKQSKFVVVQDGNPRGKNILKEEIAQCITDLSFFYSKHPLLKSKLNAPATADQLQQFLNDLSKHVKLPEKKIMPIGLEEMLKKFNGGIQLHEGFISLSCEEIIKCLNEKSKLKGWEETFVPIAKDTDDNILVTIIDNEEKELYVWSSDASKEKAGETVGLYLENLRNQVLQKKLEYIEDVGLVAKV